MEVRQLIIVLVVTVILGYLLYNYTKRGYTFGEPFENRCGDFPTGLKAPLEFKYVDNHTQAMGSSQSSVGLNATGLAESAANPLRDAAAYTIATPYTTQP
jgi:hypothetical protein